MTRTIALLTTGVTTSLLTVVLLAGVPLTASAAAPSEATWQHDVARVMAPAPAYLRREAAQASGRRLAINLDIDNTSLATHYDPRHAVQPVLAAARQAHRLGMKVFFNTGRTTGLARIRAVLTSVGYPVDRLCGRRSDEALAHSKQRCRRQFTAAGFTIVANVGNSPTDFTGSDYRRAFRLPNYHGALG